MQVKNLIACAVATALASGCAVLPRAPLPAASVPTVAPLSHEEEAYVEVTMDENYLVPESANGSDPLPEVAIEAFTTPANAQIFTTLRSVLATADTDIALTQVAETPAAAQIMQRSVTVSRMKGSLPQVVDHLSRLAGFYYTFDAKAKVLTITPDRQFIVPLPPVNELFESLPQTLGSLGATGVMLDRSSRSVSYRASRSVAEKIDGYLNRLKQTRDLVIYETHILSVDLSDSSALGINWNKLANSSSGLNFKVSNTGLTVPNGVNVSAVYNSKQLTLDMLASFLEQQGTLRTLSSPLLPVISGGTAQFSTIKTVPYLSSVGSSATTVGVVSTMQTAEKTTGIDMTLTADVSDGTIHTTIQLSIADQTGSVSFSAIGQQLNIPEISKRSVGTRIRTRPGDSILLAGIRIDSSTANTAGLPGIGSMLSMLTQRDRSDSHSELTIIIQPKRVRFIPKVALTAALPAITPAAPLPIAAPAVPAPTKPEAVIAQGPAGQGSDQAAGVAKPVPENKPPAVKTVEAQGVVEDVAPKSPAVIKAEPSPVAKPAPAAHQEAPILEPAVTEKHRNETSPVVQVVVEAAPAPMPTPVAVLKPEVSVAPVDRQPRAWTIAEGDTSFQQLLIRWSKDAGWQLFWESPKDVPISAGDPASEPFIGEFPAAVTSVMKALAVANAPVRVCFYENHSLRVVAKSVRCDARDGRG